MIDAMIFDLDGTLVQSEKLKAQSYAIAVQALDLVAVLDVVLTREDVQNAKPDPEIYLLAAQRMGVEPKDCIVIEDSPSGVRAAVAARMNVVALATPFTSAGLHSTDLLEHAWVVHDAERLAGTVEERIAEHRLVGHS
jgi:beta-phosphoglucomutase-like phosphatase (HAD superfamily)